jgi:hypothetical protein
MQSEASLCIADGDCDLLVGCRMEMDHRTSNWYIVLELYCSAQVSCICRTASKQHIGREKEPCLRNIAIGAFSLSVSKSYFCVISGAEIGKLILPMSTESPLTSIGSLS